MFERGALAAVLTVMLAGHSYGQTETDPSPAPQTASQAGAATAGQNRITCESKPGGRENCAVDTSAGVALVRSFGETPCLLGKTWGYDNNGI